MSVDALYTQTAQTNAHGNATKNAAGASKTSALGAINFFDAFLQRLADTDAQTAISSSSNETSSETVNLTLGTDISDLSSLNMDLSEDQIQALNDLSQTDGAFEISLLESLGLHIQDSKKPFTGDLKAFLKQLEKLANQDNPLLVAQNLTPEQITELQSNNGALSDFFSGMINLIKSQADQNTAQNTAKQQIFSLSPQGANTAPAQDLTMQQMQALASKLNALAPAANADASSSLPAMDGESWLDSFNSFEDLLKGALEGSKDAKDFLNKGTPFEGNIKNAAANTAQNQQATLNAGADSNFSALKSWPFGSSGTLFAPMNYGQSLEDMGLIPTAGQGMAGAHGSMAGMTSLVMQSPSAGQNHPGTQMVAATLTKAAQGGDNKTMTLQLDPPELGRVEIKMKFSADKTVKAIVTSEKPETHLMLQRDGHALEKALQDAGLDTNGDGGLSFELADEGFNFNQDGRHDGSEGGQHGKAPNGEESGEDLIESTMTWHVNPETGTMHYNILV